MDKASEVIVGKDVIESLTLGMYEDARFIFREYIQNAADQIDKAIAQGLLKKGEGEIHINIDSQRATITIEDNATGVPQNQVPVVLRHIAQSTKQRGVDKGFRGIGRLGGLAYCERLIFETSTAGEDVKSILVWDAKRLKEILNNRAQQESAAQVIEQVTQLSTAPEKLEEHYFKVTLAKVTNVDLLERQNIERYLSLVAPLPFGNRFILKSKIYEELRQEGLCLDEYTIYLDGTLLFKDYSADIFKEEGKEKKRVGEFFDIEFFKEFDDKQQLLLWGWYGLSDFQSQQLNAVNRSRGIRLRKNNIQIGNEYTLNKLHREDRGNFYFIGEVHAWHPELIPNARRDYFSENSTSKLLERKLRDYFHIVHYRLYQEASKISSVLRRIDDAQKTQSEYTQKQHEGFITRQEAEELKQKVEQKSTEALKARQELNNIQGQLDKRLPVFRQVFERAVKRVPEAPAQPSIPYEQESAPVYRTSKLSRLPKQEQKLLSRVFEVIRRSIVDKNLAENLIQKIEQEFR